MNERTGSKITKRRDRAKKKAQETTKELAERFFREITEEKGAGSIKEVISENDGKYRVAKLSQQVDFKGSMTFWQNCSGSCFKISLRFCVPSEDSSCIQKKPAITIRFSIHSSFRREEQEYYKPRVHVEINQKFNLITKEQINFFEALFEKGLEFAEEADQNRKKVSLE